MDRPALTLRQRNRLVTMREVQRAGVVLMEQRGFDATTIEDVAEASGVSVSTIYRHFGTKENVVLWDERDAVIDAELGRRLRREPPIQAFGHAVAVGLAQREDGELFLRRLRLVYSTPQIWAVAARQDRLARTELAQAISATSGRKTSSMTDQIVAAACLAALDVALDQWQGGAASQELGDVIEDAMQAIARLSSSM